MVIEAGKAESEARTGFMAGSKIKKAYRYLYGGVIIGVSKLKNKTLW